MQINFDCIRDVLLYLEGNLTPPFFAEISDFDELGYSQEEIYYSIEKLYEAGYINASHLNEYTIMLYFTVSGITFQGHEFLNTIRNDSVFRKTKEKISNTLGTASLQIFCTVASQLALELIK